MKRLICLSAMLVMLCFTAFAAPRLDHASITPSAVKAVQNASPAAAVDASKNFSFQLTAIVQAQNYDHASAVALGQPQTKTFAKKFDRFIRINVAETRKPNVWTPNVGYNDRPPSGPNDLVTPTARSGSFS